MSEIEEVNNLNNESNINNNSTQPSNNKLEKQDVSNK